MNACLILIFAIKMWIIWEMAVDFGNNMRKTGLNKGFCTKIKVKWEWKEVKIV